MIIGVMGASKSGKSTIAEYLEKRYGFVNIAFADPIKRACQGIFRFSDYQLWGPSEERDKPDLRYPIATRGHLAPRYPLQVLGDCGRNIFEDLWVDCTLRDADDVLAGTHRYHSRKGAIALDWVRNLLYRKPNGIVISDTRYRNEMRAIRRKSGFVIRVKRADALGGGGGIEGHSSETEQGTIHDSELDAVINNNFSRASLYDCVDKLLKKFPKGHSNLKLVA